MATMPMGVTTLVSNSRSAALSTGMRALCSLVASSLPTFRRATTPPVTIPLDTVTATSEIRGLPALLSRNFPMMLPAMFATVDATELLWGLLAVALITMATQFATRPLGLLPSGERMGHRSGILAVAAISVVVPMLAGAIFGRGYLLLAMLIVALDVLAPRLRGIRGSDIPLSGLTAALLVEAGALVMGSDPTPALPVMAALLAMTLRMGGERAAVMVIARATAIVAAVGLGLACIPQGLPATMAGWLGSALLIAAALRLHYLLDAASATTPGRDALLAGLVAILIPACHLALA